MGNVLLTLSFIVITAFSVIGICTFITTDRGRVEKMKNNVSADIIKVEYEGHTYLTYRNACFNRSGICHDENCRCKKDYVR